MSKETRKYEPWMRKALALAKKGEGFTAPNPMVGAILLKRGKVIGKGYHHAAGQPHAEPNAIANAIDHGLDPAGSTMVVTLEPCSHFGRTPPCVNRIIDAKISKVVIGMVDPNPCVDGSGITRLRAEGIKIVTGVYEKECRRLNESFTHRITTGKPLVVVKVACSLDGKIATHTGHSQWISGPEALRYAHRLRARYDAICVGLGTVLADDPQLTYRGSRKAGHPVRVVFDSKCRIPLSAKVVSGELPGRTIIMATRKAPKSKITALEKRNGVQVEILRTKKGHVDLESAIDRLTLLGANGILIEGGGTVLASAIEAGIVDQVRVVIAPMIIGGTGAVSVIGGKGFATIDEALRLMDVKVGRLGKDLLVKGRVKKRDTISCEQ